MKIHTTWRFTSKQTFHTLHSLKNRVEIQQYYKLKKILNKYNNTDHTELPNVTLTS